MRKVLTKVRSLFNPPPRERRWSLVRCLVLAVAGGLCYAGGAEAQSLTARLKVASVSPPVIRIDGDLPDASGTWSFRNTYGRVIGLGERIEHLTVADSMGNSVSVRRLGPAEFKSEKPVSHFSYEVRVTEPSNSANGAHVSWLNEHGGYLMLADLLPSIAGEPKRSGVQIEFQLPEHWSIASSAQANRAGRYDVPNPIQAVFFIGQDLRLRRKQIGSMEFLFATAGEWPFSSDYVTDTAARIIKDHARHVGFELQGRAMLMLASFPGTVGAERWTAETRGSNVVLLLGRNSSREALLGRLSVVLTHELFHLWVPAALSLDGDYDWFFEGFTLYQALRSAVRLGFIDFQEYLSTMARVYDSYLATIDRDNLSLVEAAQRRWTIASSLVYDKGMLVAFLCDLELRRASRNRRSLDNVYRELFRQQGLGATRADGNESIINLINHELGNEQFTRRHISTPAAISLKTELAAYGLMVESFDNRSHLKVIEDLNNDQRRVLGSLGYRKARK